jgi:hypothetical protein
MKNKFWGLCVAALMIIGFSACTISKNTSKNGCHMSQGMVGYK